MRVFRAPPEHYGWIAERAGLIVSPGFEALEAVDSQGRIRGMVAYDGWCPNSVGMHVAVDTPLAIRCLLRPAFGIPFAELGLGVVVGRILSTNKRSLSLAKSLGFREVGRLRDGWKSGVDVVLLELRRENCRFIERERKVA